MKWPILVLCAASLPGAEIRGTTVTFDGGEPLSVTAVALRAIGGADATGVTTKTDRFGNFTFSSIGAGAYLITATRPGFVPARYGQKRWNSAGLPIVIQANDSTSISIRMHRYGAISGRALDENDVGILNHEVLAYPDKPSASVAARAKTDDYGRYRIYGLEPGTYVIRSAAKRVDGVDYNLTYAPSTLEFSQGRRVDVTIDNETPDIDVHPQPGRLFVVSGGIPKPPNCGPFQITLAGEAGREIVTSDSRFIFAPVPRGDYQLYAYGPCDECPLGGAYMKLPLLRDEQISLIVRCIDPLRLNYLEGSSPAHGMPLILTGRTRDLAGVGETKTFGDAPGAVLLSPGLWELHLDPPPTHVVTNFIGYQPGMGIVRNPRPDTWNEVLISMDPRPVSFTVRRSAASVRGRITGDAHEPVQGVPVYFESYDPAEKKRIGDLKSALTDSTGAYQMGGLAFGTYRVLATFEYTAPESKLFDEHSLTVRLDRPGETTKDLDLFVLR
jgi:hypothetical protein